MNGIKSIRGNYGRTFIEIDQLMKEFEKYNKDKRDFIWWE